MTLAPKRRWLLVLVPMGVALAWFIAIRPGVSVNLVSADDGALQLDLKKNVKVNYIMSASLSPTGVDATPLWETTFEAGNISRATIRLHDDGLQDAGRLSRKILPGEEFYVVVSYQYDSAIPPAACASSDQFHFKRVRDGSIEYIGSGW